MHFNNQCKMPSCYDEIHRTICAKACGNLPCIHKFTAHGLSFKESFNAPDEIECK